MDFKIREEIELYNSISKSGDFPTPHTKKKAAP